MEVPFVDVYLKYIYRKLDLLQQHSVFYYHNFWTLNERQCERPKGHLNGFVKLELNPLLSQNSIDMRIVLIE